MPDTAINVDRRPGGISLAAAALSLLICFGAIGLIGSVAALFFTRNPLVPRIATVRITLASFDLLLLAFLVWCACTVAGLFRLRSWARYSMLVIGALDFLFFALLCGLMLLARRNPIIMSLDAHPSPAVPFPVGAIITGLALLYGLIALLGVWWLIYFNLRPVRLAFAAAFLPKLPRV
jgi:hypothetical protein